MRIVVALAGAGLIALTGCHKAENKAANAPAAATTPTPPVGFQHEPGFDAQGFYVPAMAATVQGYVLASIAMGAPSDFETWEGGEREKVFGPIQLTFNGPGDTQRIVKPLAYRLTPGGFAFRGKDETLGEIDLEGAFNTAALAQARNGDATDRPVLTGTIRFGTAAPTPVSLVYQAGD